MGAQAALEKVWQEGNVTEAIRLEKEGKFKDQELVGACTMMAQTRNLAVMIHREESTAEGRALPTKEGVLGLMKIVCPVLKMTYPFVTRCIKCAVLENMLKRYYDPKYEGRVYPGDNSPYKCNEGGWPMKNFAIDMALLGTRNLFATNACENVTMPALQVPKKQATEIQEQGEQQQQQQDQEQQDQDWQQVGRLHHQGPHFGGQTEPDRQGRHQPHLGQAARHQPGALEGGAQAFHGAQALILTTFNPRLTRTTTTRPVPPPPHNYRLRKMQMRQRPTSHGSSVCLQNQLKVN